MNKEEALRVFTKLNSFKESYDICIKDPSIEPAAFVRFKTGGMRALMKDGFDGINEVTANMLGTVLAEKFSSLVIGFDHRKNSDRYAFIISRVFQQMNKPVKVFKLCTTPYLAWESLNYDVGVMVTASHNPKEYNGFKVYKEGSQVVNPLDTEIEEKMKKIPFTNIFYHGFELSWKDDLEKICTPIDYKGFFKSYKLEIPHVNSAVPVFSSLFGVAGSFIEEACTFFNIKMNMNSSQNKMNSEFPNIPFPNPELKHPWELLSSEINLAIQSNSEENATIPIYYFMCDPDGDRFGLAQLKNGKLRIFNGNEISKIFLWYFINKVKTSEIALVSTFLCDDFFKQIGQALGIKHIETKTGFKNVSKAVKELRKEHFQVLAYEDTLGYLIGDSTERDGVKAAIVMHSILQVTTPDEIFDSFSRFGIFYSYTNHIRLRDPRSTLSHVLSKNKFESIYDGHYRYEDGVKIMLRISGTEPILKVYAFTNQITEEDLIARVNSWIEENIEKD